MTYLHTSFDYEFIQYGSFSKAFKTIMPKTVAKKEQPIISLSLLFLFILKSLLKHNPNSLHQTHFLTKCEENINVLETA